MIIYPLPHRVHKVREALMAMLVLLAPKELQELLVFEVWMVRRGREEKLVPQVSLVYLEQKDHRANEAFQEHQEGLGRRQVGWQKQFFVTDLYIYLPCNREHEGLKDQLVHLETLYVSLCFLCHCSKLFLYQRDLLENLEQGAQLVQLEKSYVGIKLNKGNKTMPKRVIAKKLTIRLRQEATQTKRVLRLSFFKEGKKILIST